MEGPGPAKDRFLWEEPGRHRLWGRSHTPALLLNLELDFTYLPPSAAVSGEALGIHLAGQANRKGH